MSRQDLESTWTSDENTESLPNEYVRVDSHGTIIAESWGAAAALARSRRTITGESLDQIVDFQSQDVHQRWPDLIHRFLQDDFRRDPRLELHPHSGTPVKVIRVSYEALTDQTFVTLWFLPISNQSIQYTENPQLLEVASRMSLVGGWELEKSTMQVRWTSQVFRLHELEVGDAPPLQQALEFYIPADRRILETAIENALENGEPFDLELQMRTSKKNLRYTRSLGRPVFVDGEIVSIQGTFQDVTEQRRTRIALLESEARYRDIFENNSAIKLIIDPETSRIVEANSAALAFYGYNAEEIRQLMISEINVDSPETVQQKLQLARDFRVSELEFRHRLASGEVRDVKVHTGAVRVNGKSLVHSIIFDITERKRAEASLQRMHQLESLGRLAGGIAHDFNNVLTIIFGNLSLARLASPEDSQIVEYLTNAENAIGRAKGLSRQLLTFAKGGAPMCENVSLHRLVTDVTAFDLSGSNVRPIIDFEPEVLEVRVDRAQLEQVISNLTLNADQAMPEGGDLRISARNQILKEGDFHNMPPGSYVVVSVQDEGCGIEPEHLARVFEPYFSTKPTGNGLGLATCFSIISRHEGRISVESVPSVGTTFTIMLPAVLDDSTRVQSQRLSNTEAPLRKRRILVLDDERMILDVVSQMLTADGDSVDTFEQTAAAVDAYRTAYRAGTPYDVVILDLTIPGGPGGKEAISRILSIDPDACAICSSGYADDHVMSDYQSFGFKGVIAKPYRAADLRHLVSSFPVR